VSSSKGAERSDAGFERRRFQLGVAGQDADDADVDVLLEQAGAEVRQITNFKVSFPIAATVIPVVNCARSCFRLAAPS